MIVDVKNKTNLQIKIKENHPFEVCFNLDAEVVGGLQMAGAYKAKIRNYESNSQNLFDLDLTISSNTITLSRTTALSLRKGRYYIVIQPTAADVYNYVTLEGTLHVE